jgi:hypothetical protein
MTSSCGMSVSRVLRRGHLQDRAHAPPRSVRACRGARGRIGTVLVRRPRDHLRGGCPGPREQAAHGVRTSTGQHGERSEGVLPRHARRHPRRRGEAPRPGQRGSRGAGSGRASAPGQDSPRFYRDITRNSCENLRRGRESNPRSAFDGRPLSKRVPSATRSPLQSEQRDLQRVGPPRKPLRRTCSRGCPRGCSWSPRRRTGRTAWRG